MERLLQVMASSLAGQVFSLATNQPTFFRAAPILFPKKIMSIMIFPEDDSRSRAKKMGLLEKMETIAKEAPWKFGFSEVGHYEQHEVGKSNLGDVSGNWLLSSGGATLCPSQCLVLSQP